MSDAYAPPSATPPAPGPRSRSVAVLVGALVAVICWSVLAIAYDVAFFVSAPAPFAPGAEQEMAARVRASSSYEGFTVAAYLLAALAGGWGGARFRRGPWRWVALGVAAVVAALSSVAALARFGS